MSLAFSIDTGEGGRPGRLPPAAGLCGLAGALLTGWYLYPQGGLAAALAAPSLCVAALWVSWRYARAARTRGRLTVDAEGRASWRAPGQPLPAPAQPCRWYAGSMVVWLRLQLPAGPSADKPEMLIVRDAVAADDWRCLQAWIRWRSRGGGNN